MSFDRTLEELLAQPSELGWDSFLAGDPGTVRCWFADARNAAAWVSSQDPARLGTPHEYQLRPAEKKEKP